MPPPDLEAKPLAGLRVLDLSRLLPGPYATMVLGDLGAVVDKIEDPGAGDYLRVMPHQQDGMNAVFRTLNRGKRSAVLDLKKPEARAALLRLIPRYDVLVETFRPGVLTKLGVGWDALSAAHPGLVYCAISGYGQTGPLANRAGHDIDYIARAGVLGFTGPEGGPPQVPGVQIADIGGGALFAVAGILAALHARTTTGRGRFVDVSMCEGSLAFAAFGLGSFAGGSEEPRGGEVLMGGIAPYNTYVTKDGKAIALGALEPKFWTAFCAAAGLEPAMEALLPGPHQAGWKKKVADAIATRTRDEWAEIGRTQDCCIEPVLEPGEVVTDELHVERKMFVRDPEGRLQPRTPIATLDAAGPAPRQGEHTDAVLRDAGFSDTEIATLHTAGAAR